MAGRYTDDKDWPNVKEVKGPLKAHVHVGVCECSTRSPELALLLGLFPCLTFVALILSY